MRRLSPLGWFARRARGPGRGRAAPARPCAPSSLQTASFYRILHHHLLPAEPGARLSSEDRWGAWQTQLTWNFLSPAGPPVAPEPPWTPMRPPSPVTPVPPAVGAV